MRTTLQKGYVIVPRQKLNEIFESHHEAIGDGEAYLRVLAHVNYKPVECHWNGHPLVCARGEAIYTYVQWASLLGWSRLRTVSFFRRMYAGNEIEHVQSVCPTHIRLNAYEGGVASAPSASAARDGQPADNGFTDFWDKYHEYTQTGKVNKERARRAWRKLTVRERQSALDHIEDYSYHHPDMRFCLQAARYLSDKAFDDEYND